MDKPIGFYGISLWPGEWHEFGTQAG